MKKCILLVCLVIGLGLGGCATSSEGDDPEQSGKFFSRKREDSKIPWAQQAEWEYDLQLGPKIDY